jgi:DNA-binding NtrC family response regulator
MPGISGRVLAQELVKIHPETRIMYMSGHSDAAVLEDAAMDNTAAFLRKPFRLDALALKIREVLGEHLKPSSEIDPLR